MLIRPPKHEVRVDITSLIDIAFLLIIFLAVTTTFVTNQGMDLDLPEGTGQTSEQEHLVVEVDARGRIFFEDQEYNAETFRTVFEERLKSSTDKTVAIRADKEATHGAVVAVMSAVKEAGAQGLSIATIDPE